MAHSFISRLTNNQPSLWHPGNYGLGLPTSAPSYNLVQPVSQGVGPVPITFPASTSGMKQLPAPPVFQGVQLGNSGGPRANGPLVPIKNTSYNPFNPLASPAWSSTPLNAVDAAYAQTAFFAQQQTMVNNRVVSNAVNFGPTPPTSPVAVSTGGGIRNFIRGFGF